MQTRNCYYRVLPRVVRADREATVTIEPLFEHNAFKDDVEFEIAYYPAENPWGVNKEEAKYVRKIKPHNGVIKVEQYFADEQEHLIILYEIKNSEKKLLDCFRIYSVKEDLFKRYPYKGDLHMHSCYSDGVESPAYVAAACRKIGLDFMALTDHGQYLPSIKAQEAYNDVDIDLKIFRGEEVHAPQNPLHIVNFGGSFSVNELCKDTDTYYKEVEELQEQLGELPEGVNPYEYASSVWVFSKIREAKGLGIYCHPYWICMGDDVKQAYYISSSLISHLFDTQVYDAFELIGGYGINEVDSNKLQLARYCEERAKGKHIPIVGVSDAHGCENGKLFGWYYTIVFSPSQELEDIIQSIKELRSVAVEALPGETVRVYGPFRLVKYALFLLREVFPAHDRLCLEEGSLMIDYISRDNKSCEKLNSLKGQTTELMNRYYGKP